MARITETDLSLTGTGPTDSRLRLFPTGDPRRALLINHGIETAAVARALAKTMDDALLLDHINECERLLAARPSMRAARAAHAEEAN